VRSSLATRARAARKPFQLELGLPSGEHTPRWRFSRPAAESPHLGRIRERIDLVRSFYPELDGECVRVGLARKRGVLGWASLDPEDPAIWVRPRRLDLFTIAHELTHLLQARGLVPRGERACDLHALARSPVLVDTPPGSLRLPAALASLRRLPAPWPERLHRTARMALAARASGRRDYLSFFERAVAEAHARAAPPDGGPPAAGP
jgi:hypothetical protein